MYSDTYEDIDDWRDDTNIPVLEGVLRAMFIILTREKVAMEMVFCMMKYD